MPQAASLGRRARDYLAARPFEMAVALYAAVSLVAFIAGYFTIFTQFAGYDDEGTLLATLKAFVEGDALYRDIYTPYGPFYYELFGSFFALTGFQVTTDASRLIVVVVWVLTSFLYGLAVQRLTERLALGLTGMIVAFASLTVLVSEPMHPQGLSVLLVGAFALLAVIAPGRRVALGGLSAGALLAALALTKINLGAFAIAAAALAAVLAVEPLHRRRWLRWLVVAAFLALPAAVMARDLGQYWVRDFILLELLASLAIVVAAAPPPRGGEEGSALLHRWLAALAVGVAAMTAAVIAALLLIGLSVSDVYRGVVEQALDIRDAYVNPFLLPEAATDWGIAALAGAAIASWLRSRPGPDAPGPWGGLLRVGVGLTIWVTIARAAPFSLNPATSQVVLPLALAWVAAVPPPGTREGPFQRYARVLLPALAVAQALQVYPVAGSQQAIAAVTFVPVGAICLADGLRMLRAWSAGRGAETLTRFGAVVLVLGVALAGKFGIDAIVRPGVTNAKLYAELPATSLAGAGRLHIPAEHAAIYERLVELLHTHGCSIFVSYPSVNSLYLWSSIPAPKPQVPGPWMRLLNEEEQRRIVDQMRHSDRPCAIRNDNAAAGWLQGRSVDDAPLVRYVFDNFEPVEEVGEFQFLVPGGED